MPLVQWEPLRLSSFFATPTTGHGAAAAPAARRWLPSMDLVETDDHFVVSLDLPGVADEDVEVTLEDNVLTVAGRRETSTEGGRKGYFRVERVTGAFRRSLTLPEGVDGDAIAARFDRGVLEVRIPKPEERKPRRVAIQVGDRPAAIEAAS